MGCHIFNRDVTIPNMTPKEMEAIMVVPVAGCDLLITSKSESAGIINMDNRLDLSCELIKRSWDLDDVKEFFESGKNWKQSTHGLA